MSARRHPDSGIAGRSATRIALGSAIGVYVLQAVPLWLADAATRLTIVVWSLGAVVFGVVLRACLRRARPAAVAVVVAPLLGALAEVLWVSAATGVWFASAIQARWALGLAVGAGATLWVAWAVGAATVLAALRRSAHAPPGPDDRK